MPLIIEFCFQSWNIMVFVDMPLSVSDYIFLIESNMFLSMDVTIAYFQLPVVYHKVLYCTYYFS